MKIEKTNKAFTIVELIFVIVIIGILSAVALPKFRGLTSNAKISSEIATISALTTALDSVNGEWSINEGDFTWGIGNNPSSELEPNGYPASLEKNGETFGKLIKKSNQFTKQTSGDDGNISIFTGPASDPQTGVKYASDEPNDKPDKNDFWVYVYGINSDQNCTINGKVLYLGDIALIDVKGSNKTKYNEVTCQGWTQ